MVVMYRGKHCPICTRYLGELNDALPKFNEQGVALVGVQDGRLGEGVAI